MSHYDTLGVSKDADDETIKRSYRKMASKHHSDREGGDDSEMAKINVAYEVLSNKEKRERYDRTGSSSKERTIEEAATETLAEMFSRLLISGDEIDPIARVRKIATEANLEEQKHIGKKRLFIRAIEKKRKAVRKKSKGFNVFDGVAEQIIAHSQTEIDGRERNIEMGNAILKMLDDYECDMIEKPTPGEAHLYGIVGGGEDDFTQMLREAAEQLQKRRRR